MDIINMHIHQSTVCDLCGANFTRNRRVLARGFQDILGVHLNLHTLICRNCSFIFQEEQFSEVLLNELYVSDSSFDFGCNEEESRLVQEGLIERQQIISNAIEVLGVNSGAAILDVGGGKGECCSHLVPTHRVVVADVTPVEPVDNRIEKLSTLISSEVSDSSYEVVVMNHVLEHVFSPTKLLAFGHRVLKDNGIIIVEVPFELYTPLVFRKLGDWRHVAYFSRATLKNYLQKSGFFVKRLVIELGAYGSRRLPVIRAVAFKQQNTLVQKKIQQKVQNSMLFDMFKPIVLSHHLNRVFKGL